MKNLILCFSLLMLSSCSTYRIANSLWYSVNPSEMEQEKGNVVNGLYFTDDNYVLMKTAVIKDTTIIAKPIYSGYGKYSCSGKLKKGIHIKIESEKTTVGPNVNYEGIITSEGMILCTSDSTANIYYRALKTSK